MKKSDKRDSIVRKMVKALIFGFITGVLFLFIKVELVNSGNVQLWDIINNVFFQDITTKEGLRALGIFYIVGRIFMNGLQLGIVPLVFVSLTLAMGSIVGTGRFKSIVSKTMGSFIAFYIVGATLSGTIAYSLRGFFTYGTNIESLAIENASTMDQYNPLIIFVNAIPNNIGIAFTTNTAILSVVVVAIIVGLSMNAIPEKTKPLKNLLISIYDIVQIYMDFLITKVGPIAIFCMISRTVAIYGVEYLKPLGAFILTGVITGLLLVVTIYPIGIFVTTGLNPFIFLKKVAKVALFAAVTQSSAATLPLNRKTCINELGCSEDVTSFVLPTGMTINMNGTTVMHMIAVTFIATAAGIDITPGQLVLVALLSITTAIGCPAIPVAGTTMVFAILTGLGFTSDLCMLGYALVVAVNYPVGMAVITLNVVGDAATDVIVCAKEGKLNKKIYYGKTSENLMADDLLNGE
ncbi:MAG: dicarboxylate/amino acid:cation symporter [Vallitaleaceae bacterium]|nr:dicarboxylate/amino acid:cation symporter [Vallitaleaceae bacterium]